jgi:hypothetical protein
MSMAVLEREAASGDPADIAEGVELTLAQMARAKALRGGYGLLCVLAFLPDRPVPLNSLLYTRQPAADLPGPEATALVGSLLNNPAKAGEAERSLRCLACVTGLGTFRAVPGTQRVAPLPSPTFLPSAGAMSPPTVVVLQCPVLPRRSRDK